MPNPEIAKGVPKYGKGRQYHRKGTWALKNKNTSGKKPAEKKEPVVKKFGKGERTIVPKGPRYFPEKKMNHKLRGRKTVGAPKLRASITPGTVLILVASKFRGRRVIFLKQLDSGLLLVSGPFSINGVPLRRISQRFVIATQTKIDISSLKLDENLNDAYFAKPKAAKNRKTEAEFFEDGEKKEKENTWDPKRRETQKDLDKQLLGCMKDTPQIKKYLAHLFYLRNGQFPHEMNF